MTEQQIQTCLTTMKETMAQHIREAVGIIYGDMFGTDYKPDIKSIQEMIKHGNNKIPSDTNLTNIIMSDIGDDLIDMDETYKVRDKIYDRVIADMIKYGQVESG